MNPRPRPAPRRIRVARARGPMPRLIRIRAEGHHDSDRLAELRDRFRQTWLTRPSRNPVVIAGDIEVIP